MLGHFPAWHRPCSYFGKFQNKFFMGRNINNAVVRKRIRSDSSTVDLHKSCGRCDKSIRMRDGLNALLCTAILGVVDANSDCVCEHYEERGYCAERFLSGQPG